MKAGNLSPAPPRRVSSPLLKRAALLLLAVAILLVLLLRPRTESRADSEPAATPGKSTARTVAMPDDPDSVKSAQRHRREIDAALLRLSNIQCYEDESGEFTGDFVKFLNLTLKEKQALSASFRRYFETFAAVESQHSEVIAGNDRDFLVLNPCAEELQETSAELSAEWRKLLGEERGAAACTLMTRQLRDAGTESLKLSVCLTGGSPQFMREGFTAKGFSLGLIGVMVERGLPLEDRFRWRHLAPAIAALRIDLR